MDRIYDRIAVDTGRWMKMQTIEAAVLVPLGLGLVVILIMLTFWMHDRVVMAAEYSSLVLEWQIAGEIGDENRIKKEWTEQMLMTKVSQLEILAGNMVLHVKVDAERELLRTGYLLAEMSTPKTEVLSEKIVIRTDPCWLKRIWRVSGLK